ncbi:DUF2628 domain-containing protein [Persephonella sp.]
MENITKEEMEAFIGKKAEYYLNKFEKFEKGNAVSWNWAAFFFGVLWMFYRKMYLYGLIAFFLIMIINIFLEVAKINPVISIGISLWLWIGFGMFGNYIYYIFVKNNISKLKAQYPDKEKLIEVLKKKGGVNKFVLYFFGAVGIVYLLILIYALSQQ